MVSHVTVAQRRVIDAAEPVTGRLGGGAPTLERLVKLGLAFRHPRPPHAYFLTPAGHRLRTGGPEPATGTPSTPGPDLAGARSPAPAPAPDSGPFAARTGYEGAGGPVSGAARTREVHSAWQGLLELRRMTRPDGDTARPCAWERGHLVAAAALALEAAGCEPASAAGPGYRVAESPQPEAVAIRGDGSPEALAGCARTLDAAGWQVSEHHEPRGGPWLLASPRRV